MGPLRRWLPLVLAGVLVLPACDGILDIDQTGIIVFEDVEAAGPAAVPVLVNGMVGNYQEAVDDIIRYSALLTDEMILSGTFDTRLQVDRRRIQVNNGDLDGWDVHPLASGTDAGGHDGRPLAESTSGPGLRGGSGPAQRGDRPGEALRRVFSDLDGRALFVGASSRECSRKAPLCYRTTGCFRPSRSFRKRETLAAIAGLEEIRLAAIAGQARAHLWLRNFPQAATLAAEVPRDFVHWAEFSQNDPAQYNEMYMFTWGDIQAIRWTVGDGTTSDSGEREVGALRRIPLSESAWNSSLRASRPSLRPFP